MTVGGCLNVGIGSMQESEGATLSLFWSKFTTWTKTLIIISDYLGTGMFAMCQCGFRLGSSRRVPLACSPCVSMGLI